MGKSTKASEALLAWGTPAGTWMGEETMFGISAYLTPELNVFVEQTNSSAVRGVFIRTCEVEREGEKFLVGEAKHTW